MDKETSAKLEMPEEAILKLFIASWLQEKDPASFLNEQLGVLKVLKEDSSYKKGSDNAAQSFKYVFEYAVLLKSESIKKFHQMEYLNDEDLNESVDKIFQHLLILHWAQIRNEATEFVDEYVEKFTPLFFRMYNNKERESINSGALVQMELTELNKILNPNIPYSNEGYNSSTIEEILKTVGDKTTIDKIKKTYEVLLEGIQYLPTRKSLTEFTLDSYLIVRILLRYEEFLESKINEKKLSGEELHLTSNKNNGVVASIDKKSFSMKEGTEEVWKKINWFINLYNWAEGDIFIDEEPVNWLEKGGKYTLVLFIDRITRYDVRDKNQNDLFQSNIRAGRDARLDFIVEFFGFNGHRIERDKLKDARKDSRRLPGNPRSDFVKELEKLINILNEKPFNRKYAMKED